MIEFEYLEITFNDRITDVVLNRAEADSVQDMRRHLATRGYVLRCQVNAKLIQSYSILERVITEVEK